MWARVTATIRPLSRIPLKSQASAAEPAAPGKPPPSAEHPASRPAPPKGPPPRRPPPPPSPTIGSTLDRGWDRRLRGGSVAVDRTVDLHGHDLDSAWQSIDQALEAAIEAGERVVLLITGHQRSGEPPVKRGRIRAAVHDWLAVSRHASRIAAVRPAHARHGGGGSLYIILRRQRPKSTFR